MMGFEIIDPVEMPGNIFKMIDQDWFLITAGNEQLVNTMTASWGGMGILWNKPVAYIFIRPQRYTYEFVERNEQFTLSFFSKGYRKALNLCGSKSGRDIDKITESGLHKIALSSGSYGFEEASLMMDCRKIYYQDLIPKNFLDTGIEKNYNGIGYHRMYVGEIINILSRKP